MACICVPTQAVAGGESVALHVAARNKAIALQELRRRRSLFTNRVPLHTPFHHFTPLSPAGFLDRHPGGREMLLLAAGRECTHLFESYHWNAGGRPAKYLDSFEIGARGAVVRRQ